jgi:hypothetical protein
MMTALLTVENILSGTNHDVWSVNVEEAYHEEKSSSAPSGRGGTGRDAPIVPRRPAREAARESSVASRIRTSSPS